MKKLIFAIPLVVMFSSTCFAEWTKVFKGKGFMHGDGNTFYIDFSRVKKHGGYVDYWSLQDFLTPWTDCLSKKSYQIVKCNLPQQQPLKWIYYKESMGQGRSLDIPLPLGEVEELIWVTSKRPILSESDVKAIISKGKFYDGVTTFFGMDVLLLTVCKHAKSLSD